MLNPQITRFHALWALFAFSCEISRAHHARYEGVVRSAVFLSPEFILKPGSVANKFYYDVDFPRGHIGIKSFNAEVVDETGEPIPLHETYLHHWIVVRYYHRVGTEEKKKLDNLSDFMIVGNSGLCQGHVLPQYFGLGSETRRTDTYVPDPYAIEVGNPAAEGYEERWLLNVHAIDTRGAVDRLGCTECRCHLYNVTRDEYGRPLGPDYEGGLSCCYDGTQCKVKEGFAAYSPRRLYLRYSVEWVAWEASVLLPVRIYIFDVTDAWKTSEESSLTNNDRHDCKIEFEVKRFDSSVLSVDGCTDTKRTRFVMPRGGYVIYGVAHQHSAGIGSVLYTKDGRVICSSSPLYGDGKEAGNEAGYIVGMSTCYPQLGSVKIDDGETLVLESNYNSSQRHTGVMGLFYILVADQVPLQTSYLEALIHIGLQRSLKLPTKAKIASLKLKAYIINKPVFAPVLTVNSYVFCAEGSWCIPAHCWFDSVYLWTCGGCPRWCSFSKKDER